jgi:hypothetical protein
MRVTKSRSCIHSTLHTIRSIQTFLLLICLSVVEASWAEAAYIEQLIDTAQRQRLADSRAWFALLHYKPGGLLQQWESQADDAAFFLAADGKYNPQAELVATIRAMAEPVLDDVDQHPQCRFPARYHWLQQQLPISAARLPPIDCSSLNEWFDTIRPGSLTLVFPSAYINSPSSMFGHTLLRINPDDHRKDSPLVAYALNYAANADATDSALIFSIKGLIGGYPGVFSIVPYYEKIKEYSDLENRDVWEYELDLTPSELRQLMRHAWEVRYIQFDYFFLTENCSYHMLSLMEAARPGLALTSQFEIKAIPSDTVRAVIEAELVTQVSYRPSSTTILTQHAAQMRADDNSLVICPHLCRMLRHRCGQMTTVWSSVLPEVMLRWQTSASLARMRLCAAESMSRRTTTRVSWRRPTPRCAMSVPA